MGWDGCTGAWRAGSSQGGLAAWSVHTPAGSRVTDACVVAFLAAAAPRRRATWHPLEWMCTQARPRRLGRRKRRRGSKGVCTFCAPSCPCLLGSTANHVSNLGPQSGNRHTGLACLPACSGGGRGGGAVRAAAWRRQRGGAAHAAGKRCAAPLPPRSTAHPSRCPALPACGSPAPCPVACSAARPLNKTPPCRAPRCAAHRQRGECGPLP